MLVQYTTLFLAVALLFILVLIVPGRLRGWLVLAGGYVLYYLSGTANLWILPLLCVIIWSIGLGMKRVQGERTRRALYLSGLAAVLAFFMFFKISSYMPGLAGRFAAPLGLSFFALEAYAYLSDCYHGRIEAQKNPLYCFLFLSFFPTITAGPIERPGHLIPQFKALEKMGRRELADPDRIADGAALIVYAMFVKLVIADRIGILVDHIYGQYYRYGMVPLFIGMIGFGIQLYGDFMGYSMLASGIAQIFGIRLIDNFRSPYLSTSITDFWRKWHVSLSSWLRDYVYIPLGGNRRGRVRKCVNLLITFAVSGFWHGSGAQFMVWGLLHGAGCVISNATVGRDKRTLPTGRMLIRAFWTFLAVNLFWVFFRADSIGIACAYIRRMFAHPDLWLLSDPANLLTYGLDLKEMCILLMALLIMACVDFADARRGLRIDEWLASQGAHFRVVFLLFILIFTILYGRYGVSVDPNSFYYMSF